MGARLQGSSAACSPSPGSTPRCGGVSAI